MNKTKSIDFLSKTGWHWVKMNGHLDESGRYLLIFSDRQFKALRTVQFWISWPLNFADHPLWALLDCSVSYSCTFGVSSMNVLDISNFARFFKSLLEYFQFLDISNYLLQLHVTLYLFIHHDRIFYLFTRLRMKYNLVRGMTWDEKRLRTQYG